MTQAGDTGPGRRSPHSTQAGEGGFTLVELMVSMVVMLLVVGSVFTLIDPSQSTSRTQPEAADVIQRLRVSADMMEKDLLMAGAGIYADSDVGSLINFFPPILPYRTGKNYPTENAARFFSDRISIAYVPHTASQTSLIEKMPQTSSELKVSSQPGCPDIEPPDNLCGFKEGMRVLIFDRTGTWDFFSITQVQSTGDEGHLQHNSTLNANDDLSKEYTPDDDSRIAQVETHVYWLNQQTRQLFHYDGSLEDVPIVDNVAGLRFRYFGEPDPANLSRPLPGQANCIFDATGTSILPKLTSDGRSLVELSEAELKDGPWCGSGSNQFDADLFRIRKVAVQVRIQASAEELRGANPAGQTLFQNPGTSNSAYRRVPDYMVEFDVAPRNLNLLR